LTLHRVKVCATAGPQGMTHAEDVAEFIAEQAIAVPGEIEDDDEAFTHGFDIASDAGQVQIA
jgi:hypothetical protein